MYRVTLLTTRLYSNSMILPILMPLLLHPCLSIFPLLRFLLLLLLLLFLFLTMLILQFHLLLIPAPLFMLSSLPLLTASSLSRTDLLALLDPGGTLCKSIYRNLSILPPLAFPMALTTATSSANTPKILCSLTRLAISGSSDIDSPYPPMTLSSLAPTLYLTVLPPRPYFLYRLAQCSSPS
jgi:hypothetical protein